MDTRLRKRLSSNAPPVSYGTTRFRTVTAGPFQVTDAWFAAGETLPPHHHDRTVVGVTLAGEWVSLVGRTTLRNRPGVLHTEPAGDTHSNLFGARGTRVLIVQPDGAEADLLRPCQRLLDEVNWLMPDGARATAIRLQRELAGIDDLSALSMEALCMDLLASGARARRATTGTPLWLTRVIDYLNASFRSSPSLAEVATVAGVHPSHLVREFKRVFRETPAERTRRMRLEWAATELRASRISLSGLAAAAGFSDQSHFTRHFRRQFRMTPGEYRRLKSAKC